jgi:hypothetical protein
MQTWSYLFTAIPVELRGCEDVREGSKPMEHHSSELDHQNEGEKEDENKAYGFQLEIFLGYQHLWAQDHVEITHCLAPSSSK